MLNTLIILLAVILLVALLFFEKKKNQKAKLLAKAILSGHFILAALVQLHAMAGYFYLLLVGLIFCLGGDVFLALPQKRMFLLGLISFLLGHICYVFGFLHAAALSPWSWIGAVVGLIVSGIVFVWLKPHLGSLLVPVMIYIVVITAMVVGAWTVVGDAKLNLSGRLMVWIGAWSFYLSDIFVARDRFIKSELINRFTGLPLYYFGQFMLAFSIGLVR